MAHCTLTGTASNSNVQIHISLSLDELTALALICGNTTHKNIRDLLLVNAIMEVATNKLNSFGKAGA